MNQNQKETDTYETEEDAGKICKLIKFYQLWYHYLSLFFLDGFYKTPSNSERKIQKRL